MEEVTADFGVIERRWREEFSSADLKYVKIGVIDGGWSKQLTSDDINIFESLKIAPVSHLKSCTIEGGSLSANAFMCVSAIGCIRTQLDFFGIHQTTFEGIVPGARIYAYPIGCEKCSPKPSVSESIEAIGKAIQDGVKVVSVSIDFSVKNREYQLEDPKDDDFGLKILDAMKEDILTCLAVGDDGPIDESAMNGMPWALTVGAHTGNILETDIEIAIRRDVPSIKISYDENEKWRIIGKFKGSSLNVHESPFLKLHKLEDVYDKDCVLKADSSRERCYLTPAKSLWRTLVVGSSASSTTKVSLSKEHVHQLSKWQTEYGKEIFIRIRTSKIEKDSRGVLIPEFSSRGPSRIYKQHIIPELVAPGYAILIPYPSTIELNQILAQTSIDEKETPLLRDCNIVSGSSIACSQVAGAALILRSYRPHWTPLEVKSAIITTAKSFAAGNIPGNELVFGAGSINIKAALYPGLVYDESWTHFREYVDKKRSIYDLNLPTFAASFSYSPQSCKRIFRRELKNVGDHKMVYKCVVKYFSKLWDPDVEITAVPDCLEFERGEKQRFELIVNMVPRPFTHISALLMWIPNDGGQSVCSPIHLYHQSEFDKSSWYE
ncbi:hypothetical protein DCAR_0521784 [Daucus carota subsp. sativus]|uniref:Peptidase S8/S53 domain-containing protein n=1 Tax=Daucus carota subsp. sativus TaxID=79200 RepID=A0AAF0X741_DAUCS|nr:PREDICTED: subtilisin-like protease SBT4.15 [Daucus carota subsp. sativus]WOH02395.1 hypothetical protein DCAR_0521784 [Daucus carota subsp. sativus]